MGFLTASTPVWVIRGLVVVAVFAGGIWLKARLDKAEQADNLKTQVTSLQQAAKDQTRLLEQTEADRLTLDTKLREAAAHINTVIKTVTRTVVAHAPKSPACDYDDAITTQLNCVRGYTEDCSRLPKPTE